MQITERDARLLSLLYEHRFLRTDQLWDLMVDFESEQMLWKRLRLMRKHSYVVKLAQREQGRTVYCLEKQGAKLIAAEQNLPLKQVACGAKSGKRFLAHKLAIADFRVALTLALRKLEQTHTLEWVSELQLRRQAMQVRVPHVGEQLPLNPDGLAIFEDPAGSLTQAYLEIDLATETHGEFVKKVEAYLGYTTTENKFPQHRLEVPFCVLVVTTSNERMANLIAVTRDVGGRERFYFTTLGNITAEAILTEVWKQADPEASSHRENRGESKVAQQNGRAQRPAPTPLRLSSLSRSGMGYINPILLSVGTTSIPARLSLLRHNHFTV